MMESFVDICHSFQACVRFHTCCMLTCTVNDGMDTLPRDKTDRDRHTCSDTRAPLLPTQIKTPSLPPSPPTRLFGMRASDIDKYSRVIFPIMFISFHLMYWMIFLSLAGDVPEDMVYLKQPEH